MICHLQRRVKMNYDLLKSIGLGDLDITYIFIGIAVLILILIVKMFRNKNLNEV